MYLSYFRTFFHLLIQFISFVWKIKTSAYNHKISFNASYIIAFIVGLKTTTSSLKTKIFRCLLCLLNSLIYLRLLKKVVI
uniref:Hypothetical secreted peptide n=1 Tax=Glossina morsitans morsitans TaxID=37546 RepID=D3TSL4_GLOMM